VIPEVVIEIRKYNVRSYMASIHCQLVLLQRQFSSVLLCMILYIQLCPAYLRHTTHDVTSYHDVNFVENALENRIKM